MPKEQSKMDNPAKLALLGTQDTRRRQPKFLMAFVYHANNWIKYLSIIPLFPRTYKVVPMSIGGLLEMWTLGHFLAFLEFLSALKIIETDLFNNYTIDIVTKTALSTMKLI